MHIPKLTLRPNFGRLELPNEEREDVFTIECNLTDLASFCDDFRAALILLIVSAQHMRADDNQQKAESRWFHHRCMNMAGRDGAMTLFHIGNTLLGIKSSFKSCPDFNKHVDQKVLRDARKAFDKEFPANTDLRHAVAHAGEMFNSPANRKKNAFSGSFQNNSIALENVTNVVIKNGFDGPTYYTTFLGEIVSYNLDLDALNRLQGIISQFASGFKGNVETTLA